MRVKVKCPNADCGMVLVVDGSLAGKKGKCSTCNAVFTIPKPRPAGAGKGSGTKTARPGGTGGKPASKRQSTESAGQRQAKSSASARPGSPGKPAGGGKKSARRRQEEEEFLSDDMLDEYIVEEEEAIDDYDYEVMDEDPSPRQRRGAGASRGGRQQGARRQRGGRAADYEDDDEYEDFEDYADDYADDYEDDYDDYDRGRGRRRGRGNDFGGSYGSPARSRGGGRPKKQNKKQMWTNAKVGNILLQIATCVGAFVGLMIFLTLTSALMTYAFRTMFFADVTIALTTGVGIGFYCLPLAWITAIVGYIFTMMGPNTNGTKALSITGLVMQSVRTLFVLIVLLTASLPSGGFGPSMGLSFMRAFSLGIVLLFILTLILGLVEMSICALTIGSISKANKDRWGEDLTRQARILAIIFSVGCLFSIVLSIFSGSRTVRSGGDTWGLILAFYNWGLMIVLLIYYFKMNMAFNTNRSNLPIR